jgi:two-component system, OmpR family, heavy metal sensor histidine kinase CusS
MKHQRSMSTHLAVMFAIVTATASAAVGGLLYLKESTGLSHHAREVLEARFVIVERLIRFNEGGQEWVYFRQKLAEFTPTDGSLRFIIESEDPRFRVNEHFSTRLNSKGPQIGFGAAELDGTRFLTKASRVAKYGDRPEVRLIIVADQTPQERARRFIAAGILALSLFTIAVVTSLGWWIARRGMRTVDRLSEHARHLGGDDLARRLPTGELPIELSGLVLALNAALDRLQKSHQQLSDFNADVAHELRTPLTNMIGETEVALSRRRNEQDLCDTLQSNLEELERLRGMVNDMLLMARADAGEAGSFTRVSLAAECRRAVDFMEILFDEVGTTAVIRGDGKADVERALFGRALTNLLDNALRHGEPGGQVVVQIDAEDDAAAVTVINPGPAIPLDHLPKIFDRFFCGDPARASNGHSHGLGLAIVAAVARIHGGDVHAENGDGVVKVKMTVRIREQVQERVDASVFPPHALS